MHELPYLSLSAYLRQRFGKRVQKIPLDAGMTCPNRDGTISRHGCAFCNPKGSGTGLYHTGEPLAVQWSHWKERLGKKYKTDLFLGYLQSYTNTYGPLERIQALLDEIVPLPGLVGICLGTRPDCIDPDKAALLANAPVEEFWVDLGLQSSNNATLERIGRGHSAACFAQACRLLADNGLLVCAHVMAGLPGETDADFLETVRFAAAQPIAGIKFHNLYVAQDTRIATWYHHGLYTPLTREAYIDMLVKALCLLPAHIVVHRLTGDPAPGELVAPEWARQKQGLLDEIRFRLL
ncbi:TIGR01212 family radical SAM protein, partial [Desulfovibrio inopinatus]|uniref:TIGR01212 family radical SAM protein n=1 Tax=Desulfovibrio inopinatus TaxID=102109 RepID=UPI000407CE73